MIGKVFASFEAARWNPADPQAAAECLEWLKGGGLDTHCPVDLDETCGVRIGPDPGGLFVEPGQWIVRIGDGRHAVFTTEQYEAAGFVPAAGYLVLRRDVNARLHDDWDGEVHETMRAGVESYRHADRHGHDVVLAALVEVEA